MQFLKKIFGAHRPAAGRQKIDEGHTVAPDKNGQYDVKTCTIGGHVWMAENLDVDRFRNGDPIPEIRTVEEWVKAGNQNRAAWCWYRNDPLNGKTYRRLYNWHAVGDVRGLAPEGWHVPADGEWDILLNALGGAKAAGGRLKETGTAHWRRPNAGATNTGGFSVLPCGYRYYTGEFYDLGSKAIFWTSTKDGPLLAWGRQLNGGSPGVDRNRYSLPYGFSVRCVRD
jgi:uncharacterized protein (TIGR02145 family)